jgi:tetratricopeptide (TPR) repeat protein
MKSRIAIILIVGSLFARYNSHSQPIEWKRYYGEAIRAALDENKLLLLYFGYGPSGMRHTKMDLETWTDPTVSSLANNMICVRDFLSGNGLPLEALKMKFRIQAFPTTVIIDAGGKTFFRFEGEVLSDKMLPVLRACPKNVTIPYIAVRQLASDEENPQLLLDAAKGYNQIGIPHMSNQYFAALSDADTLDQDKKLAEYVTTYEAVNLQLMGNLDDAKDMLEDVIDEYEAGELRPLQLFTLFRISMQRKDTGRAEEYFGELKSKWPENQYTAKAEELFK